MQRKNNGHPLQIYYSRIYKRYDLVNTLFTFGLDKKWRNYTANVCLSYKPGKILDLCCGTGDIALYLAKKSSGTVTITGYDLNAEMLKMAREKALQSGAEIEYILGDASSTPFKNEAFDCVTIGFGFRNLTWQNPLKDAFIKEINRILKPGGRLFILESAQPENRLIKLFYSLYLKLVLVPIGGILSGDWEAYKYLAGSSAGFYKFYELKSLLGKFDLDLETRKKFLMGSVNLLIAIKK